MKKLKKLIKRLIAWLKDVADADGHYYMSAMGYGFIPPRLVLDEYVIKRNAEFERKMIEYMKLEEIFMNIDVIRQRWGKDTPEAMLLLTVMKKAIDENDREYFQNEVFEIHCEALGLDSAIVRRYAINALKRNEENENEHST